MARHPSDVGKKVASTSSVGLASFSSSDFAVSEAGEVTITSAAVQDASTTVKGIASFAASDFDVSSGAVSIDETMIQYASVTITAAEVKALAATAKELVAAPGAGKMIELIGASFKLNYGSEVFTESDDDFVIKYTNASGAAASSVLENTGFIDASADTIAKVLPVAVAGTAATSIENQALVLDNDGDGEIGGNASNDSTVTVRVAYRVHTL